MTNFFFFHYRPWGFFPPSLPFCGLALQGIPDIPDMSVFARGNSPTDIFFSTDNFFSHQHFFFVRLLFDGVHKTYILILRTYAQYI